MFKLLKNQFNFYLGTPFFLQQTKNKFSLPEQDFAE